MKKILFLLLCTVQIYGQTTTGQEQEFDYGIKNNSTQTITTPPYLTTTGIDGTQGKIPSALIAKTSDVADSLATKENVANKTDSYTASSSTAYVSGKALVEGLGTKQNALTNPTTGAGSNVDPNAYALQDGTILYHSVKWFVPTGAVSTTGTTVTSVGTQFTSAMVGAKLTINGEWRIITGRTSSTIVTVASAYSQNYSGVVAGSWGVFSKAFEIDVTQQLRFYSIVGQSTRYSAYIDNYAGFYGEGFTVINSIQSNSSGMFFGADKNIRWSKTSGTNSVNGTKDLGLRRNTAGVLEIYDGVTADGAIGNRRDLLVRNVYSEPATLPNQVVTKAQLDETIPETYSIIVYVNSTSPNTATVFDDVNPPIANDDSLKADTSNLYIGTDASSWVYDGSFYVTKSLPRISNFYLKNSIKDAGNVKHGHIERFGPIEAPSFIKADGTSSEFLKADGSSDATAYAPLASPTFTGTPTAPTAAPGTTGNQIATLDYAKSIAVEKISTGKTLTDSDNGKVILLTASCTVTLPNGLMNGFNCSFATQAGATLTYSLGGSVVLINNAGTTMGELSSHTIVNTGVSNEYLTVGL